jgi:hypothetical protein
MSSPHLSNSLRTRIKHCMSIRTPRPRQVAFQAGNAHPPISLHLRSYSQNCWEKCAKVFWDALAASQGHFSLRARVGTAHFRELSQICYSAESLGSSRVRLHLPEEKTFSALRPTLRRGRTRKHSKLSMNGWRRCLQIHFVSSRHNGCAR